MVNQTAHNLFRFRVQQRGDYPDSPEALCQFFKEHLEDLLKVICLTQNGKPVDVDGFVFMKDRYNPSVSPIQLFDNVGSHLRSETNLTTKMQARADGLQEAEEHIYDLDVIRRTEPRLEFLHATLARVGQLLFVEVDGDGHVKTFRLRELEHWTTPSEGDPYEVLTVLSRTCNARCQFCYVHGNPANTTVKLSRFTDAASASEANIRLAFYSRGLRLPHPTYDLEEILLHPQFFSIARRLREISDRPICITTNGYLLNDEMLNKLQALDPIEVSLSLNAVTPSTRQSLMGGRHLPGLEALSKLAARRIRTTVTLVAWPTVSYEELERVIRYSDQFHARTINVILGGYTKYFPDPAKFEVPRYWEETVQRLAPLRAELRTPFVIQPRLFEEQVFFEQLGEPRIIGISPYSAASWADLRIGDIVRRVGEIPVLSRPHCNSLLALLREASDTPARLTVERAGELIDVELPRSYPDESKYLYGLPYNDRFGIFLLAGGIPVSAIRQIFRLVNLYHARNPVLITSLVVRPLVERALEEFAFLAQDQEVEFTLLEPRCQFYGGNIVLGDLLVVDDLLLALREHLATSPTPPDLVLVPTASFNYGGWFRDIKGQPLELLRRALPLPVEPIVAANFE